MYKLHGKLNCFLLSGHFRELKIREILLKFFRSSSLYVQHGNCKRIFYSCLPIVALHAFQVVAHGNCKPISVLMIADCRFACFSSCRTYVTASWKENMTLNNDCDFLNDPKYKTKYKYTRPNKNSNQYHFENYSFQKYRTTLVYSFNLFPLCVWNAIMISSVAL